MRRPLVVLLALATVMVAMGVETGHAGGRARRARQAGVDANWPQWRGPHGNGVAQGVAPIHFDADNGVRWKYEVPGRGYSSPIVWDDLVFLTTAVPIDEAAVEEGRPRRRRRQRLKHDFRLIALRRSDGTEAWTQSAAVSTPHEGYHRTLSSYANASPVTDGETVFAFFGSRGLYAYDFDGDARWSRTFDVQVETFGEFGEASSPALHGDTIVVLFDHQGQSFIEALDKHTGSTLWKQLRDEDTSWSSPLVIEYGGRELVVALGSRQVTAYELATGDVAWVSEGLTPQPIPTPVAGHGLLYAASGSTERRVHAIDLGDHGPAGTVSWKLDKAAPYNPSPLLWGEELYLVRDGGLNSGTSRLSLFDAVSGEERYLQHDLPGRYSVRASPVGAGDHLYLATEEGDVLVIKRGEPFELVATNSMREPIIASPAIAQGQLFLRGRTHLFCIGQ